MADMQHTRPKSETDQMPAGIVLDGLQKEEPLKPNSNRGVIRYS